MRILLVAINAKYIHSNLAVYSLKAYADLALSKAGCQADISLAEYTINQPADDILMDIYEKKPDVLCFSSYIWNMEYVRLISGEYAKICPETPIWLGGPEASYEAARLLAEMPHVKGIMKGEGEATFAKLSQIYGEAYAMIKPHGERRAEEKESRSYEAALRLVAGITYRDEAGEILENPWREPIDLNEVPFVYKDMEDFANKIVYYESSRGCPFRCSYCLSSVDKTLRLRDLSLVFEELRFFLDHKVPQVKFVDRTFNCRHDHSLPILQYIKEHDNGVTNFHFEVAADILSEEELALMDGMRPGLIQLEVGVQSTNLETVKEIHRTMDLEKLSANVARVKACQNIHQHLDLIAGLPFEDLPSFKQSFDDVYAMHPDQLQLGFLKVLKGSYMYENREAYELVYSDTPPYEVRRTKWLSFADVVELKGVEEMVEVYYNSGQFSHTIERLEAYFPSSYAMYQTLADYYKGQQLSKQKHKRAARYEIFLAFVENVLGISPQEWEVFKELLTMDYYLRENAKSRPAFAGEDKTDQAFARHFYEKEAEEHRYLADYEGYDKKQLQKMTHLETFPGLSCTILFDYKHRNPLNQDAKTCMIKGSIFLRG